MLSDPLRTLALGLPLVAATLTADTAAAGCPDNDACGGYDFWADLTPVNAARIPADGVLVLQGTHHGGDDADWLAAIDLVVTLDGQPIAGALATTSQHGVLTWRPDAPWEPGATYQLQGTLTNPDDLDTYCGSATIDLAADIVIDAGPGGPIEPPAFTGTVTVQTIPEATLETLACCSGITLSQVLDECGRPHINGDPGGQCAPTTARGYIDVGFTVEPAATGPLADQIAYTLKIDGSIYSQVLTLPSGVFADAPFCAVIEAQDLASGAVTISAEQCFGQDIADQLGLVHLDPHQALACHPEQCEVVDDAWDPDQCTPYDSDGAPTSSDTNTDTTTDTTDDTAEADPADDTGCACATTPSGRPPALALLALLALLRRRR